MPWSAQRENLVRDWRRDKNKGCGWMQILNWSCFWFLPSGCLFIFWWCSSTDHPASGASVVCNVLFWCRYLMSSGQWCSSQQLQPRSVRINEQKQLFLWIGACYFFPPEKTSSDTNCCCCIPMSYFSCEGSCLFYFTFWNYFLCVRKLAVVAFDKPELWR